VRAFLLGHLDGLAIGPFYVPHPERAHEPGGVQRGASEIVHNIAYVIAGGSPTRSRGSSTPETPMRGVVNGDSEAVAIGGRGFRMKTSFWAKPPGGQAPRLRPPFSAGLAC